MTVAVEYTAQLKRAIGTARESYELAEGSPVTDLLTQIALRHPRQVARILLDPQGHLVPSMLVFVDEQQIVDVAAHTLRPGNTVTFFSPISGG